MIRTISEEPYLWLDANNPTEEELGALTARFKLHPAAVQDCLQPEHLPKYEHIENMHFILTRYYDQTCTKDADSIQGLSRKIAIFCNGKYMLTIHRQDLDIRHDLFESGNERNIYEVLYRVLKRVLMTYEEPVNKLDKDIDFYESRIFLKKKIPDLLKSLYLIKRRIFVMRKLMNLTKDTIEKIELENKGSVVYQDMRDYYTKLDTQIEEIHDSIQSLLNIYISLASQRTNEVMRVLTVFSAFFLPLTFVVGVYGMNFDFMPELRYHYGYAAVWLAMLMCTLVIYSWFKRKGWM